MQGNNSKIKFEKFFENNLYKVRVYAVENYQGSIKKGHQLSLSIYFYPPVKNVLEKAEEFHETFKKYCSQLKIPVKSTCIRDGHLLQEYYLDGAIIALGYSDLDQASYLNFTYHGDSKKISKSEIKKTKKLFKKFRLLLESQGCKSKKLDDLVDKLSKGWLKKKFKGSYTQKVIDIIKENPNKIYELKDEYVYTILQESYDAEEELNKYNLNTKKQKQIFEIIEQINEITRPLALLFENHIKVSEGLKQILEKHNQTLNKYKLMRESLLIKAEEDPKQREKENYKEYYVEALCKLKKAKTKKEKQNIIKQAKNFASKFDYNPEKDLEHILEENK